MVDNTIKIKEGTVIANKYRILGEIGCGGMSIVYLAVCDKSNKRLAVKSLRKRDIPELDAYRQSLATEIKLLGKLKHKSLPSIVDVIEQDDNLFIVMDYVEGMTLDEVLKRFGAQKQEDVVNWAIQLCDVLSYLHSRKPAIIHRDIKPSNIMLKKDGNIVLIDFGTAREYKEYSPKDTSCLGTKGYAAPEQFGGCGQTDARTDIYSLGATMYHLLTGRNPSDTSYEAHTIPHGNVSSIILKCMRKNPNDRYQSAKELMNVLKNYKSYDRKTIRVFAALLIAALLSAGMSAGLYCYACEAKDAEYGYYIDVAKKESSQDERIKYYLKAIDTDSTKSEAYNLLIDDFVADGEFSTDEEEALTFLRINGARYLQKLEASDRVQYADLCYRIGNAYWFYYEHEESSQTAAVAWFEEAASLYQDMEGREAEYRRCNICSLIGNFYRKVIVSQTDGTDTDMYVEYWNNLLKLKSINDKSPDSEVITLRLYHEIVSRSMEYAGYLERDGISAGEIETVYDEIDMAIGELDKNASQKAHEEIEDIKSLMAQARRIVRSNGRG